MSDVTPEKPTYKKTLNLPRTQFPMRANLSQNEPASQKRWAEMKLYERVISLRDAAGAEPFVFHDGPPYANGSIHVGHLLNKVMKDIVVRSQLMDGRQCKYIPGWDCHGLPIEARVMTALAESGKLEKINGLDDEVRRMAIRRECQRYAEKHQKHQSKQLQRLSTLADYEHPYLTMTPTYERAVLEVFARLVEEKLVYRALKSIHWSIANETALAEAELEYQDREDLSVYVSFEAEEAGAALEPFGVEDERTPGFLIWTTTPWTIPANLAIAVREDFTYALVESDGALLIIAEKLVGRVSSAAGKEATVLGTATGRDLVGLRYRHPLFDQTSRIVAAGYVTLEEGTGLVHTAPGHGADDYGTGLKEGLDIYCPVLGDGTYDDTVPEWLQGMSIWDANPLIAEHLDGAQRLYHSHILVHSYPHDWRSKTPVIFRATDQWFVAVDKPARTYAQSLRAMALEFTEKKVRFTPDWGRNRLRGMLETRPDWCISRQRSWGLPIPAFQLPDETPFMTAASVRAVADAFGRRGSDAWFTESPKQLLDSYDATEDSEAPEDLDIETLTKNYDIFDVWFEAGSSWNAVMRERDIGFPCDLYLEGSDQHRGWFQLSMLPALGATGMSPFKDVVTHGFTVDKHGHKMSKSLGNAMDVEDILKDFGVDVCRWWVSSVQYESDIRMDIEFLSVAGDSYRKVRNTLRFLLGNLDDFDAGSRTDSGNRVDLERLAPTSLDAYVLGEAGRLQDRVRDAYRKYEFRRAHQSIYDFCNDTLSAFYLAALKDRLYCDRPDSARRRAAQTVLWSVTRTLCQLLAPILPHTAEEAYQALRRGDDRSVHTTTHIDLPEVAVDPAWDAVLALRDQGLKALEEAKGQGIDNSLDAEVVLPDPEGDLGRFDLRDLADILGVSRVTLDGEATAVRVVDLRDEARCDRSWMRDGTVRQRSDGGWLTDRDAEAVGVA